MKLIRLADRITWATVQEYVSDDLASDTDDDKHIQKSIRAAAARKGKAKPPRKFRNAPYHTEQKGLLNHRDTTTTKACRQNIRNLDVTKYAVGHAANSDTSRMNVLVGDVHRTINHHSDRIDNGTLDTRYWEHESGDYFVASNIKNHFEFWKNNLQCSQFVLNILQYGYYLPLREDPPEFYASNNKSSLRNSHFVELAITELLQNQCIEIVSGKPPCCINPLTVAEGEKRRLVLDLRHVNKYLDINKFRYETLATVSRLFETNFFFITFDLKSGYHHVPIAPAHKGYLGFSWKLNG